MALITAADVREVTGLSEASNTPVTTLIARAEKMLAKHCGYPSASPGVAPTMESTTYTRYSNDGRVFVDADNGRLLRLRVWPVTAITSIHEDPEEAFGSDELVASDDYTQRGDHGQIVRLKPDSDHGSWTTTEGAIKVVFVAGFAAAHEDLKAAIAEQVAHLHELKKRRGKVSIAEGERTTTYRRETIPRHVRQLISPFRLPGALL